MPGYEVQTVDFRKHLSATILEQNSPDIIKSIRVEIENSFVINNRYTSRINNIFYTGCSILTVRSNHTHKTEKNLSITKSKTVFSTTT